jgi:hypothetical protein
MLQEDDNNIIEEKADESPCLIKTKGLAQPDEILSPTASVISTPTPCFQAEGKYAVKIIRS